MISENPAFKWPDPDAKIWRYMNVAGFASLVLRRSLFFPRATKLQDPYEGSVPTANIEALKRIKTELHTNPQLAGWKSMPDEAMDQMIASPLHLMREMSPKFLISCWHKNKYESEAMWRLYTQANEAICIQSTFARLAAVLPSTACAGLVKYIDYQTETLPMESFFNFILCKRSSFEHEQEIRAVILDTSLWSKDSDDKLLSRVTGSGLAVPVHLVQLIEKVYVSPTSPPWFVDVVKKLLEALSLNLPVTQSSLSDPPMSLDKLAHPRRQT